MRDKKSSKLFKTYHLQVLEATTEAPTWTTSSATSATDTGTTLVIVVRVEVEGM